MLATAEPIRWTFALAATGFGLLCLWTGWRGWTGRWPGPFGPRPPYQSYFGGAFTALLPGVAFTVLGVGEVVRGALGWDDDGPFFLTVSIATVALGFACLALTLWYFWLGVPPALRPPYQRDQGAATSARRSRWSRLRERR